MVLGIAIGVVVVVAAFSGPRRAISLVVPMCFFFFVMGTSSRSTMLAMAWAVSLGRRSKTMVLVEDTILDGGKGKLGQGCRVERRIIIKVLERHAFKDRMNATQRLIEGLSYCSQRVLVSILPKTGRKRGREGFCILITRRKWRRC